MQVRIQKEDTKKGVCYIIGAGRIDNIGWLKRRIKPQAEDYVIAADGGYEICSRCGIPMHLVVGDFDSLGFTPEHPHVQKLQPEKDDTDLLYAVKTGLESGYHTFEIYGALGGRPDHALANYQTLVYLAHQNACGVLCSPELCVTAIRNDCLILPAYERGTVSVFCMGDRAKGVTLDGLKYPLKNAELTNEIPLGVSNEFTGNPVRIEVAQGTLLVMWEQVI